MAPRAFPSRRRSIEPLVSRTTPKVRLCMSSSGRCQPGRGMSGVADWRRLEIALLRSLPLFAELPAPAIEGLAAALRPVRLDAGAVLIRQGDPGDAYFAI